MLVSPDLIFALTLGKRGQRRVMKISVESECGRFHHIHSEVGGVGVLETLLSHLEDIS